MHLIMYRKRNSGEICQAVNESTRLFLKIKKIWCLLYVSAF